MGRWRLASTILKGSLVNSTSKLHSPHFISNPTVAIVLTHFPNHNFAFRVNSRLFSAIPSRAAATYINELDPIYTEFNPDSMLSGIKEDEESGTGTIPIKAYFLSTSIDLKSLQAENISNVLPPNSRSSNYVALRYCDFLPSDTTGFQANKRASCCRYMVVCQYGSAVLFNIEDHEIEDYLSIVRRHASGLLCEMRKDDYAVKEKPMLLGDMQGGPDYIVLKALDTDGIRIIGSVLGQSIALDYFVSQVDGMVEEFAEINRIMEKTGTFTMDRCKLLQLVGKANSNLADVILKVGLFERSEIAWREAKYAQIYEYLREEFEVTQRFGNLNLKLKFVEHNIHFLQEVIQNKRSNLLEWCIIFLLSIENIISLYEIIRESNQVS